MKAGEPNSAPPGIRFDNSGVEAARLYTQIGSDPSFQSLLEHGIIPVGRNSSDGVKGLTVNVNKALLKQFVEGNHPIPQDIGIHTLGNSVIRRKDFSKWSRWYQ